MSIEIKLASLAETAKRVTQTLETEEATKTALILPFLMALDYNVFDPTEVVPEYQADVGVKSHERVDYALLRDGQPIILIEAKQVDVKLDDKRHLTQLFRYWNATPAKVGILTNGIEYRFFGDTDQDNLMDESPFLTINITKMSPRDVASVSAFSKYNYNLEDTEKLSEELFYQDAIRKVILEACKNPQTPFVRWMMTRTYDGMKTAAKIEWFKDQIKIALKDFGVAEHQPSQTSEEIAAISDQVGDETPTSVASDEDWTSLEDFVGRSGGKAPSSIKFLNGEERDIRYWSSILLETSEWLIRQGKLTKDVSPVKISRSGGKSHLIHIESEHADGREFTNRHQLSNGLWLNPFGSVRWVLARTRDLMEHCDQDTAQVWLKTG